MTYDLTDTLETLKETTPYLIEEMFDLDLDALRKGNSARTSTLIFHDEQVVLDALASAGFHQGVPIDYADMSPDDKFTYAGVMQSVPRHGTLSSYPDELILRIFDMTHYDTLVDAVRPALTQAGIPESELQIVMPVEDAA